MHFFLLNRYKNYKVVTAQSGIKALEILSALKPDIILLDVMMQEMSGYEVCLKIQEKEDLSLIPVIFLTALTSAEDKAKAFSLGAADFLTKPIDKNCLYGVIEKHAATESKWRRFLDHKGEVLPKSSFSPKPRIADRSFPNYCNFLFDFLNIPDHEREPLKKFDTEGLSQRLQERHSLSKTRFSILMAQFVDLDYLSAVEMEDILLDTLPPKFCKHNRVVSVSYEDGIAFVLTDPFNMELINILQGKKPKKLFVTSTEAMAAAYSPGVLLTGGGMDTLALNIQSLYPGSIADLEKEANNLKVDLYASPLVRFVNKILEKAYAMEASDIHIEPFENMVVIRYRIDGELIVIQELRPKTLINIIVSRIKIMSRMDIVERRLPQDGRFSFKEFSETHLDFDVRVSSAPMKYGEKVVMRLLGREKSLLPLDQLGFSDELLACYRGILKSTFGMILHVGPTGSGKSMSLYSAINEINHSNINIQTAEDPIEYTLDGISQMQVNPAIGLTFKEALRCFLRQDPDTILVGEIRDKETAQMAVEASLTGHLLFSTLHTNDASSTFVRFIEMGIAPYLISSSILLICAQRLVKRLCLECRQSYTPDRAERKLAQVPPGDPLIFYRAVGCPACNNTGYKGRIGIYELLIPNDRFRSALVSEIISTEHVRKAAMEHCGMVPLFMDALEKVRAGVTSMEEVMSKVTIPG